MNMHDWAGRVGVPLSQLAMFLAIALWGDSAVFTHRDSLFILLFTVLSGENRRRANVGVLADAPSMASSACWHGCSERSYQEGGLLWITSASPFLLVASVRKWLAKSFE